MLLADTLRSMMVHCNHKQRLCTTCGHCPRCPECDCRGPRRSRGRPRKHVTNQPRVLARAAASHARVKIKDNAEDEAKNDSGIVSAGQPSALRTPADLLSGLGIAKWELRRLPSAGRRELLYAQLNAVERAGLQHLLDNFMSAIASVLLPADGQSLVRSFREDNVKDSNIRGALIDGVRVSRKGSVERRTLRSLLCATSSAKDVYDVLKGSFSTGCNDEVEDTGNTEGFSVTQAILDIPPFGQESDPVHRASGAGDTNVEEVSFDPYKCHVIDCVIDKMNEKGTATGHNCGICKAPVHLLCCQRLLKIQTEEEAILYCSQCLPGKSNDASTVSLSLNIGTEGVEMSRKQTSPSRSKRPSNIELGHHQNEAKRQKLMSGYASRRYQTSRKDWDFLLCHGHVPTMSRTLKRTSDESIKDALKFLFRAENVQLLSWGTKKIKVDGRWVDFPAVIRKLSVEKIFRNYQIFSERDLGCERGAKLLARSSFTQIVNTFTRGQQKRKAAVDYVLGTLVYDSVKTVRDIVSNEVPEADKKRDFLDQLCFVEEFLKFTFLEHVCQDGDAFHDIDFALHTSAETSDASAVVSKCNTCLCPFQLLFNIEKAVGETRTDVTAALHSIKHKFMLYLGHQHRCFNQEKKIAELFEEVKRDPLGEVVVILLDYKMKFEAIRFREKTTEFFGKKGMSWHGAVVFYNSSQVQIASEQRPSGTDANLGRKQDEIGTLFFDHILSNDMTQDRVAVCSILDAIMARLRVELPLVKAIYLLSDNARCYQNDLLPVMAPFLAKHHRFSMLGFVHSETQRGKSLVDAHFALAMMHITRFCNETKRDVTTPGDVVEALNSFGGVANCTAEMIHLRRNDKSLQSWISSQNENRISKHGRVNEYSYKENGGGKWDVKCFALSGREYYQYEFGEMYSRRTGGNVPPLELRNEAEDTTGVENLEDSYLSVVNPEEVAYQSTVTGVTVWARARLRRQMRKRAVRAKEAIEDTVDAILTNDSGNEYVETAEISDLEEKVMLECGECKKPYRRESALKAHKNVCEGPQKGSRVLDRAGRFALSMLGTADAAIYTTRTMHPTALSSEVTQETLDYCKLKQGWAQRPAYGKTLGDNFVSRYETELKQWFMDGEEDKGKKMSASRMREMLKMKYPRRYDIPGEHNITSFISGLVRKRKKSAQLGNGQLARDGGNKTVGQEPGHTRRGVAARYVKALNEILDDKPNLMPRMV